MKLPLSWLKEYVDIETAPIDLGKMLTMAGLEVDAIEPVELPFRGVVVGHVVEVAKHPQADKLCVATVSDGTHNYQVVCGAPNCRAGLKVAFAREGAVLHDEQGKTFEIKKTKLRGVDSFGMLCGADELQLGDDSIGIMELPSESIVGQDLATLFNDTIFEISLTPNLGHCASVVGVARELAAVTGKNVKIPQGHPKEGDTTPIEKLVKIKIADTEKCPRFACRMIQGVKIAPSPNWLKNRLEACGIRSINNVVDATNYVLMELGHPLHAFDFDKLSGQQLVIRCAKEGEVLATLDGKERKLGGEELVICDQEKPVSLAGVMGGANSEVSDATTNILIESAYFEPRNIRRTSKRLGIQTEASKHYERGADPNNVVRALNRVTELIQQLAGGTVVKGLYDVVSSTFPEKIVVCRLSRINKLLGTLFSDTEVAAIFKRLDFAFSIDNQETFHVHIPSYRPDITIEADLIEEVARIYGYDNIDRPQARAPSSKLAHSPMFLMEREVRSRLIAEGLQEFLTCDLIGPTLLNVVGDASLKESSLVRVVNPTSIEQSVLRYSLLPGLLQVMKYNYDHQNHNISGFEIGSAHFRDQVDGKVLYREQTVAGIILMGENAPHHWDIKPHSVDFFDLKGIIENLLQGLSVPNIEFRAGGLPTLHPGRQASIFAGSAAVGSLGEVHPSILRRLDITTRIFYAEIDLEELLPLRKTNIRMERLPLYPGSVRDWTVTLREEVPICDVMSVFSAITIPLLEGVEILDVYRSERLGSERKNVTFRFTYRDRLKTVAQEEVDMAHAQLTGEALKALGKATI